MAKLRGELFKAGEGNTMYKLRWFELWGSPRNELRWHESAAHVERDLRGSMDLTDAFVTLDPVLRLRDEEERFGFRINLRTGTRVYALQCSSAEERRLWVDEIEQVAQPELVRSSLGAGRVVQVPKHEGKDIGIELGSRPGMACVTVLKVDPIIGEAASRAGLYAGDVVLTLDSTVLRNAAIAKRMFKHAEPGILTLRLSTWMREVRLTKQDGKAGIICVAPASGDGVIISELQPGGGGERASLQLGDRLLSIDGELVMGSHALFAERIRSRTGQEVRIVVSGFTTPYTLRKDTEGILGLQCDTSPAPRGVQGAVLSEVVARCAAREAGLRSGDVLVACNGELVRDGEHARRCITASGRTVHVVVWRPRLDAPDPPVQSRAPMPLPSAGAREADSQTALDLREWYHTADASRLRLQSEAGPIYVDLTERGAAR